MPALVCLAANRSMGGVSNVAFALSAARTAAILRRNRAKLLETKGIYFLYRIALTLASPFLLLVYLYRAVRGRAFGLPQVFGFLPASYRQTLDGAIWLHAVSMGEVLTVEELLRRLRAEFPRAPLYVSTTTQAGYDMARRQLAGFVDGIFFLPLDFVWTVRRVLRAIRPSLVVVAETEIWPNLYRETKRIGAGLVIVNGRISDRAFPRYLALRGFFRHVLRWPDAILAQDEPLRRRFLALGAPVETTRVSGNLKYDFELREPPGDVRAFLEKLAPKQTLIAASTMPPDEEDTVITAWKALAAEGRLLILAPRKPERFDLTAHKLREAGIPFVRRTALAHLPLPGVLLLDSLGELGSLFPFAGVVFMGGTLVTWGGHNILEPAFAARPILMGPYMQNFRQMALDFLEAKAAVEVADGPALARAVEALWGDPEAARDLGRRALDAANARRGATARVLEELRQVYVSSLPSRRPVLALWLRPLTWIWKWGGAWKRARALARRRSLPIPVISVGNLTMGGAGKTPFVVYLAAHLPRPGIVTRGYRRRDASNVLALPAGARVSPLRTGDEAQIFLRAGAAPVAIGADRFEAGERLVKQFQVETLLLDDGFQHARLQRTLDIVLVDGLNPLGELFPLGRMREPAAALARADIVVITRHRSARLCPAIEREIRRHNARAPILHSDAVPRGWVRWPSDDNTEDPPARVAAFCGLGNPQGFWATLGTLGITPLCRLEFGDHHQYKPRQLRRLAQHAIAAGAQALVTTQKDAINLPEDCHGLLPLPVYWLRIAVEVEEERELLREVANRLGRAAFAKEKPGGESPPPIPTGFV